MRHSVLIVGSEAAPFAKTGGLADVLGALPPALATLGWDVTLALPKYRGVESGTLVESFSLAVGGYVADVRFFQAGLGDARVILIDIPDLFDRSELYGVGGVGYPDNARRFAALVRAALEFVARCGARPSLVHAHDWQAGLAPVYLNTLYANHPVLAGTPSVFTIHNLAYQGLFEPDWLPRLDLPWDLLDIERLEFWGKISFLKGGINDARMITTVSPTYAAEIQTPEFGSGFDGVLRRRAADLAGILNGIDTVQWDPASDPHLPAPFSAGALAGKRQAKRALLARYRLPCDRETLKRPVVGMISRMVDQKGFDLIASLDSDLTALEATWVVLGTGEARYQDLWRNLAARYPDRVGVCIGFDEGLAHLIEGGADLFLMPSFFEPCGLNQMYSLRYGTVPLVRRVGGLADTVRDSGTPEAPDPGHALRRQLTKGAPAARTPLKPSDRANGFLFDEYRPDALLGALRRALETFKSKPRWRALQLAGMAEDHSWDRSAQEYVRIYETVIGDGPG